MSDRLNLADQIPEPPDSTLLIVKFGDEYRAVQRNDALGQEISEHDDERWFDMSELDSDPLTWQEQLKFASQVYACGRLLAASQKEG